MNKQAPTPGPWEARQRGAAGGMEILAADSVLVARAYGAGVALGQANAALLAAAPELLAVVETVVDQCPMCAAGEECQDDACYAARAALALARGEGGEPG